MFRLEGVANGANWKSGVGCNSQSSGSESTVALPLRAGSRYGGVGQCTYERAECKHSRAYPVIHLCIRTPETGLPKPKVRSKVKNGASEPPASLQTRKIRGDLG